MNFIKKSILFSITVLCFSASLNCMHDYYEHGEKPKLKYIYNPHELTNINQCSEVYEDIGEYLVQLLTILSLNTTKPLLIKSLACARGLSNAIQAFSRLDLCTVKPYGRFTIPFEMCKALYNGDVTKIFGMCFAELRARNIFLDYNVFKSANDISTKNLKSITGKKKWLLGAWLTANKIVPFIIADMQFRLHKDKSANYDPIYWLLAEVSELYRQKLVYSMLLKNKERYNKVI